MGWARWRRNRAGLVVAGFALLAAAPGVLAVVGVRERAVLAAAAAAVVAVGERGRSGTGD